jgi:PAS domain S-box-containing protein
MKTSSDFNISYIRDYFYRLVEKSQDIFWIRDVQAGSMLYVSPAFGKIFAQHEARIDQGIADYWLDKVHPEDKDEFKENHRMICDLTQRQGNRVHEYRIVREDGSIRRLQETMFCLYAPDEKFFGLAGVTKDISHERLELGDLEKAMHYFHYFAEKIDAVFWARNHLFDKQIYISPAYEKIWGRSRDEVYRDPSKWSRYLHPDDIEKTAYAARMRLLEVSEGARSHESRFRIVMPDESIKWIKDTCFPIHNEQNVFIGFAGISEDVTSEVLYEQTLREAKERAEVANKAKSDFLAMISHEIRTPLNAIMGMADILKVKGLPADMQEKVDIIANAGHDLLSLVGDILDFARLEAGKLTFVAHPFNIAELFQQVLHGMKYQTLGKEVELLLEVEPDMPAMVVSDQNRVRQVLSNLISNAVKFTDKGFVKVHLRCAQQNDGRGLYEVTVTDTGIGIPASKLGTIFEKFSQVDSIYQRKHGGIGLGLSITKELIENMGGQISVQSELGKGATFSFTLNLLLEKHGVDQLTERHEDNLPLPSFNMRVLVVEDNLINQKIARMMLEDMGCQVDMAGNGVEVFERLEHLAEYSIIFMDVGLPDMSGYDIASKIRCHSALQTLPIVAMTAHVLERDRQQAYLAGMNDIIAKPVSYERIRAVLECYK